MEQRTKGHEAMSQQKRKNPVENLHLFRGLERMAYFIDKPRELTKY